ncbi:MAG TPA: hypothetical protein DC048_01195 [Planctomycetaceae bacterium]|nr:hypothetical protein [Planctomycetaceae bacterium]
MRPRSSRASEANSRFARVTSSASFFASWSMGRALVFSLSPIAPACASSNWAIRSLRASQSSSNCAVGTLASATFRRSGVSSPNFFFASQHSADVARALRRRSDSSGALPCSDTSGRSVERASSCFPSRAWLRPS